METPDLNQLSLEARFYFDSTMRHVREASKEQLIELYASLLAHHLFHKEVVKKLFVDNNK